MQDTHTHRGLWQVWGQGQPQPSPVVTVVTLEGTLLAVPEADVVAQRGGQRARHVTQGALVVVHWAKKGEKRQPRAGQSAQPPEAELGAGAFTHHGSSCGRGAASPWQTSWSSGSTETSALQQWGREGTAGRGQQGEQHREQ